MANELVIYAGGTGTQTISSTILVAGLTGGLTKFGPGTLYLNGANTYTGSNTLNGGILALNADSGAGNAAGLSCSTAASFPPARASARRAR